VNVLIALIDPVHVDHDRAHDWFAKHGQASWATCPITENGVLRIVGHRSYPNSPGPPVAVAAILKQFCELPGYKFWADNISLVGNSHTDPSRLLSSGQLTDTYLLALAKAHKGALATFDSRLVIGAVSNGRASLHLIL
jgi:toxin-antitoxin system PIN domain toxin